MSIIRRHKIFSAVMGTGLSFLVLLIALLCTQAGLSLTLRIAQAFIPGTLHVESLHGNLYSGIQLAKLSYTAPGIQLSLDGAQVSWHLHFVRPKISFSLIAAQNLEIKLSDVPNSKIKTQGSASKPYGLLKRIRVNEVNIQRVQVSKDGQELFAFSQLLVHKVGAHDFNVDLNSSLGTVVGKYHIVTSPNLTWYFNVEAHDLNLDKAFKAKSRLNFSLSGKGLWSHYHHEFEIDHFELQGNLRQHSLHASGQMQFINGETHLQTIKAQLANANFSLAGDIKKIWDLNWKLSIPDLHTLLPQGAGSLSSSGQISGQRELPIINAKVAADHLKVDSLNIAALTGSVRTQLKPQLQNDINIDLRSFGIDKALLPELHFEAKTKLVKTKLSSRLRLSLDEDNQLQGLIELPNFKDWSELTQKLQGQISIHFKDLSGLNTDTVKAPYIDDMEGQLNGLLTLAGTLGEPLITGSAQLENASVVIPAANLLLETGHFSLKLAAHNILNFEGSFNLGTGLAKLSGSYDMNQNILAAKLKGDSLQVMDTPEYQVQASPALSLDFKDQIFTIKGQISIPNANLAPADFSQTLTLPSEVVVVEDAAEEVKAPVNTALNIELILQNKIAFKYKNLKTDLQGKITIHQNPGNPLTASGELSTANGSYKAYGKALIIDRGRLIYTGNLLSNPGLDIRAIEKIKSLGFTGGSSQFDSSVSSSAYTGQSDLTVGIQIRGTLNKPQTTMFSDPAGLSQGDILSYLLLGQPQSQASGAGSLALLDVASGMVTGDDNSEGSKLSKIQDKLGLTELGVGTTEYFDPTSSTTQTTTTANIGKNLGHNLSVHYSVSLFDSISILSLRYKINKYFAVQSETSTLENGGDLLYQIESEH